MIDYRYLTFIDLVETKNYTKTAERLSFTQPAITKHIQYIEKTLNVNLFTYEDRKLITTSEGDFLYARFKKILAESEDIINRLQDSVNLKIGVSKTIGEYLITDKLAHYNEKFPNSNVSLMVDNTITLLDSLNNRKIDLALISGPLPINSYKGVSFFADDLILICSAEHPFANRKVNLADILTSRLFIREEGAGVQESVEHHLHQKNLTINDFQQVKTLGSISLIKSLVQQNEGVSFIYKLSVAQELNNGSLRQIHLRDFQVSQEFFSVSNPLQPLNEATKFFLELF